MANQPTERTDRTPAVAPPRDLQGRNWALMLRIVGVLMIVGSLPLLAMPPLAALMVLGGVVMLVLSVGARKANDRIADNPPQREQLRHE
ncbi:hypothetical protein [Chitinolyticbacter meiyuanensis]|uniref:hypothetical protein n=1 Tax=Chitinolyticbacter meiyuanensis TaxID=682798 RepID=UPI0011E5F056|nr:hypothetical protein [Chitinolyticbacter meiyuanensis]